MDNLQKSIILLAGLLVLSGSLGLWGADKFMARSSELSTHNSLTYQSRSSEKNSNISEIFNFEGKLEIK